MLWRLSIQTLYRNISLQRLKQQWAPWGPLGDDLYSHMQSCHVLEYDKQKCDLTSHLEHISASFLSLCNFLYLITCPFIQWTPGTTLQWISCTTKGKQQTKKINNNKYPQNFWGIECEQCNFRSNEKSHIWLLSGYLNTSLITHINI